MRARREPHRLALVTIAAAALAFGIAGAAPGEEPLASSASAIGSHGEGAESEPGPGAARAFGAEAADPLFDDDFDAGLAGPTHFPDPWEPSNRSVLWFNGVMDRAVFGPITRAYGFAVPGPVRKGVRNMIRNVSAPATIVNDVLQLEWRDSGVALSRLAINSTLGIAGIFDTAEYLGLEYHDSDFGQTLAMAGTPSGPYLVLPLLGPATLRDGFGSLVDAAMNPLFYIWGPISFETLYLVGGVGLSTRDEHQMSLEALQKGAIDFYAALRSAYYQNRQAQIWGRREHRRPGQPEAAHGPVGDVAAP